MAPPSGPGREQKDHRMVLAGLMLGILLASLDQTIVGTSLFRIVQELGGADRFTGVVTAYLLSSTIFIPLAGKMSDRVGRRVVFLASMGTFLLGSMLCGIAQDIDQLIFFRFLQGAGAGGLFPVAFAAVADMYPPSERGRIQGVLGAVFGLSAVLGPLLGGYLVDNVGWRWVFYVNLPVGVPAILITWSHFTRTPPDRSKPIDVAGAAAMTAALSGIVLASMLGGSTYAWDSAPILGLLALGIAGFAAFVLVERRAQDPLIPLGLFRSRTFSLSTLATMFLAVGLFGVISFLPVFMQAVIGVSATNAGEVLTPLMVMVVAGSMLSGRLMKRTGFKLWIALGPPVAAAGLLLLSRLGAHSGAGEATAYLLVIGLGLGFTMATYVVAVQNEVQRRMLGVASSTLTLARSLGGTLGIALLGALFTTRLKDELAARLPAQALARLGTAGLDAFEQPGSLPPLPVREALAASLDALFVAAAVGCGIAWLLSLAVKPARLKTREEYLGVAAAEGSSAPGPGPGDAPVRAPVRALASVARAEAPVPVAAPWAAPRIVRVRHDPPFPEPGAEVTSVARLAPRDGAQEVRVEVWRAGERVASAEARVPAEGAEVRLRWRAPAGNGPITTSVAPPARAASRRGVAHPAVTDKSYSSERSRNLGA